MQYLDSLIDPYTTTPWLAPAPTPDPYVPPAYMPPMPPPEPYTPPAYMPPMPPPEPYTLPAPMPVLQPQPPMPSPLPQPQPDFWGQLPQPQQPPPPNGGGWMGMPEQPQDPGFWNSVPGFSGPLSGGLQAPVWADPVRWSPPPMPFVPFMPGVTMNPIDIARFRAPSMPAIPPGAMPPSGPQGWGPNQGFNPPTIIPPWIPDGGLNVPTGVPGDGSYMPPGVAPYIGGMVQ